MTLYKFHQYDVRMRIHSHVHVTMHLAYHEWRLVDIVDGYAFLMSFNAGFYGNSGRIHGHPRSILNASPNSSCYDDINHEQHEWDNRRALMFEYERNQDLVFKLTDEVKKTMNESMESVISGLRNEVTELRSELASIKKEETSRCCV